MTITAFIFSVYKRNTSTYDAYWSVIPFYFVCLWVCQLTPDLQWQQILVGVVVSFWSWRLTHNWYRGWPGWHHEDWRYVDYRNKIGANFVWMNFGGLHLFPTLIVFSSCLGLFWVYKSGAQFNNLWLVIGCVVSFIGTLFELFADNSLHKSRLKSTVPKREVLREGLWSKSRNPNYLGEILFWFGIAFCGIAASAPWWTVLGCIAMYIMFWFVSIPLKEERMMKSRAEAFAKYKNEVSKLLPF
jgi:steroid 5-alpha reductase family enzyme